MDGATSSGYSDALALLDRRIELEILRLRARYQLSLDEFRGLYISDEQVDGFVAAETNSTHTFGEPLSSVTATLQLGARWSRLVDVFELSALEQDVLLLALAPELDLKYETLYAYLNNDVTRKWPTLELARRLLASESSAFVRIATALAPESKLRARALIEPIEPPGARPAQLNLGFALCPSVARFLTGLTLTPVIPASAECDSLIIAPALEQTLRGLVRLFSAESGDRPVVALCGEPGSGRDAAAHALANALGLPLRRIDFRAARHSEAPLRSRVETLALELRLEPAVLCLSGLETLCDREGHLQNEAREVLQVFDADDAPLVLVAKPGKAWRGMLGRRRVLTVHFPAPDFSQRLVLWRHALREADIALADDDRAALADRFQLGPAQIDAAVRAARDATLADAGSPTVSAATLLAAARAQSHMDAHGFASKVQTSARWEDLVLPPSVRDRLHELSAAIRHRHVVYSDWGFAQHVAGGHGIKALFAGASGTGKTMAAGVIARELGLDLYKIDLAGVVSKYIGETEKNLDRIFEAARVGNAVLFFDEADAVFGKRSEVKDAHDRYANVETAYLLQKLEEHDGVVFLASNFKRNIDEAFARRLHYVVDFPKPDAEQRERLWRGMFPSRAPRDADIDFAFLARQFELAGGDIRNVVLDAAFLATHDGSIGMRHIVHAMARQLGKQGKTATLADFQCYHPLLYAADVRIDVPA